MASIYDRRKLQQTDQTRQFGAPAAARQQTMQQPNVAQARVNNPRSSYDMPTTPNAANFSGLNPLNTGSNGNQAQLQALLDQILNRPNFKYDLDSDMLYQQYRDQYQRLGQQAMQDTMGQAATMTGGYGNSYAATAGNQEYQQYLTQLNNIVPELYDRAYNRYNQDYQALMDQYSLLMGAQQYQDQQNQQEESNLANAGWQLLQSGVMPSAAQLAAMGISQQQAQSMINNTRRGGGGGGDGSRTPTNQQPTEQPNSWLAWLLGQAVGSAAGWLNSQR